MIRNDLTFYESTAVLCFGYNPMAREASQKLSDTFTVHFYTGNRKISFFHKYFKPINTWLCSMKTISECMQMFKQWYLQMMDGGCTKYYRITGNY